MRQVVVLAFVYALVAALIVPGSLLAAEGEAPPPGEDATAEDQAEAPPTDQDPGVPPQSPPAEQPAAQPAPAAEPAPAPPAPVQEAAASPQADAPAEQGAEERPVARAAAPGSVTIKDFSFSPASITVNVGEAVTWTNSGPTAHSATANDGSFDTGVFPKGQSRSHTFQEAGTFSYICTPHPQMKGTVRVLAASSGGGDGGSGGGAGDSKGGTASGSSDTSGSADSGSGAALPNSGADAGALALLGLLLIALGAATRRRAAAQPPAYPGRIGW
jgi:plastocyanin